MRWKFTALVLSCTCIWVCVILMVPWRLTYEVDFLLD